MKKKTQVMHVMRKNIRAINLSDDLQDVTRVFSEDNATPVPVMHEGRLMGILHSNDIPNSDYVYHRRATTIPAAPENSGIRQLIKQFPTAVSPTDTLAEAATIFARENTSALPVIENGRLVGIITAADIIHYLLEED
ncbi:MAG: CBS domain-containing protein [Bacteroidia bacterium]|nr:CBS domain-containing protein [Bacteroidia bacterium]